VTTDQPNDQEAGERLEWRVWPAAQRPVLSIVVGVIVLGVCAIGIWSFRSGGLALVAFLVLLSAVITHYIPSHYRLDQSGASARHSGGRAGTWEELKYAFDFGYLIVLSPTLEPKTRAAQRRAVMLKLNDNHDEVVVFLRKHVQVIDKRKDPGSQYWPK
jgi:hypothetical protein